MYSFTLTHRDDHVIGLVIDNGFRTGKTAVLQLEDDMQALIDRENDWKAEQLLVRRMTTPIVTHIHTEP